MLKVDCHTKKCLSPSIQFIKIGYTWTSRHEYVALCKKHSVKYNFINAAWKEITCEEFIVAQILES